LMVGFQFILISVLQQCFNALKRINFAVSLYPIDVDYAECTEAFVKNIPGSLIDQQL
jgi:hypothetical protein